MAGTAISPTGLWNPLWAGVALSCLGAYLVQFHVPEPHVPPSEEAPAPGGNEGKEDGEKEPELDSCLFWNVIIGSFLDNMGNTGLTIALNTVMIAVYAPSSSVYGTTPR